MVKCQVVMEAIDALAPRALAESWDNVGLMAGSPAQDVHKILVCLDVSESLVKRAVQGGFDMIVSHHPLFFKPLKNLRTDLPQGRLLQLLLENRIAVFSAHTNLDIASGGVNDVLAELLGLENIQPFARTGEEELVKLVVFVPQAQAGLVREAIGDAGAGHIGRYSHCSFQTAGQGSFLPLAGTQPFIGEPGRLETVAEVRLETILPARLQHKVIKAMLKAHPYEEVAYDLYPLKNAGDVMSLGRIGQLPKARTVEDFARDVKRILPGDTVRLVCGGRKMIRKIALCSGSGAEFIAKAAYMGADAYVTGDVKYHDAQKAEQLGIHVIDAGHFGTEMPIVRVLAEKLAACAEQGRWNIAVEADAVSRDLFQTV